LESPEKVALRRSLNILSEPFLSDLTMEKEKNLKKIKKRLDKMQQMWYNIPK